MSGSLTPSGIGSERVERPYLSSRRAYWRSWVFSSARRSALIRSMPSPAVISTSRSGSMPGSSARMTRVPPSRYSSTRTIGSSTASPQTEPWERRIGWLRNHSSSMLSSRPNAGGQSGLRPCSPFMAISSPGVALSQGERDVLRLQVLGQALVATLAADAALLHPAERRRRVADVPAVDPDHAELERLAQPPPAGEIAGVDVGDQAVLGAVGVRQHLVVGPERHDRRHRSEDLLLGRRRPGGDVEQHGRRVEPAGPLGALAAEHRPRAGGDGLAHDPFHLLHRLLVDQGAEADAVVVPAADRDRAHSLGEPA